MLILDTGIVGIITNPKSSSPEVQNCKQWFKQSLNQGVSFILPEIADYEIRRELLRSNKSQGINRLNELKNIVIYLPNVLSHKFQ